MTTEWDKQTFTECVHPIRVDRGKQVKAREYLSSGKYPVVDQGQGLVAGWTDSEAAVIRDGLPYVVFGDHTRLIKYVDFPFALGADGTKLIKPKDDINPLYFYFHLLRLDIPSRGYSRHYGLLKEKAISLPPFPEQKKIAAVLLRLQRAIETQEKIMQSLSDLKKSTMQHLFTRGLRGEKTKMTEIGEIPESWEVVRMEVLGEIVTGTTPPTKRPEYYEGGGYQFIAPADLGETTRIYRSEKEISGQGLAVSRVLPRHTACFVCIGSSIGKVGITVAEASTSNQQINAIIPYHDFDPFFVTFLLLHRSAYIAGFASPSPVPILSKGKFAEILIPITRKQDEQKRIQECLLGIEDKIDLQESKKSALQNLFKTTLNKLMTGDIRVGDLDINVKEVEG